jgi:small subunit ribosomal protein S4
MGKNLDNKCKQCRRLGEKLYLKGERCYSPKCAIIKRNYAPGFHGLKGQKRRLSDYGLQLAEKQKVKKFYGILEKQFKLSFDKAEKLSGDLSTNFLRLLETRLDNVVYRLGWASSRQQARQLVNHSAILIEGKKASVPSMIVKSGQVISVKENKLRKNYFKNLEQNKIKTEIPSWLNPDKSKFSAKVLHEPKDTDLPLNFKIQLIIEYYSK